MRKPGAKAKQISEVVLDTNIYIAFNPHSSFRPSATWGRTTPGHSGYSFNPHSSFRPSATKIAEQAVLAIEVSILTRAFARVRLGLALGQQSVLKFQSSLELSPECDMR